MVENKNSIQTLYLSWLSTQVSPAQLSELYFTYSDIESFCLHSKILSKPFFETTDIKTLSSVKQTVESNKYFRSRYRSQTSKIITAIKYYYQWVRDNQQLFSEEESVLQVLLSPTNHQVSEYIVTESEQFEESENKNISFVDFYCPSSYAFTNTKYLEYFGERINSIKIWTELYTILLRYLFDDYPEIILSLCGKNISNSGRVDIANIDSSKNMVAPKEFAQNLYV